MFAVIGLAVAIAIAGLVAFSLAGAARVRASYRAEKAALLRRARPATFDRARMSDLPPPVRRYLEATRAAERPPLRTATLVQRGTIRPALDKAWIPFTSEQVYTMEPPGFLWLADARLAPLLSMTALDAYVDGHGSMRVKLAGLFRVADARGPEIDQGAALRYWGEIVAFSERVLDPRVTWEPIDERQARMIVADGALRLSLTVTFDDRGLPLRTHADRHREVNGSFVLTPWSGYSRSWQDFGGRLFPTEWEAVWHLPDGDIPAVRMRNTSVRVE